MIVSRVLRQTPPYTVVVRCLLNDDEILPIVVKRQYRSYRFYLPTTKLRIKEHSSVVTRSR